jgi:parvulin-like peptidyl-prolyl isomerase
MYGRLFLKVIVLVGTAALYLAPAVQGQEKGQESKTGANDATVIAKVGDTKIVYGDLNKLIKMMPPSYQAMFGSTEQVNNLLQRQIDNTLFAQEARRLKVDKDPEVQYKIEEFTKGILTQALLEQTVNKNIAVSEQEIKQYYDANTSEFQVSERVKASHILIAVPADASESVKKEKKAKAEEILAKIKKGEDFSELAKQHSDDAATKNRGGVIGFFSKGSKEPAFEEAVAKLKKDEVSSPVLTSKGYNIIKVLETKAAETKSLEESRSRISNKLEQKKRNDAIEALLKDIKKRTDVVIYEDALKKIVEASKPSAEPNTEK